MSDELKTLATDLANTWETELKPRLEQAEQESKSRGEEFAETKQSIDRVQDRLDELEVQAQKAALAPESKAAGEPSEDTQDYLEFARHGIKNVREDTKLQGVSNDYETRMDTKVLALRDESLGGVLAPVEFINEVIKGIVQFSPIRSIARVRPTSRTAIQAPKRTGNFAAQWTGEVQTRTETTGRTYGLEEIPTHELYARVLVSNWDLEDPVVDLEAIITEDMSEFFGVAEGTGFVSGNGVGKPEGFLNNADVETVLNGGASFVQASADALINLTFQLKEQYWPNARFVLNRFSLRDIRKLKDNNNNYLWATGVGPGEGFAGLSPTILGYPYLIAVDMPTAASNALTVAFGDFMKAYWIADRIEIATLRDPFTQAAAGAVVLHARKRVGGQVVLPEAIKFLKMA